MDNGQDNKASTSSVPVLSAATKKELREESAQLFICMAILNFRRAKRA
jgi:hypothetical protein